MMVREVDEEYLMGSVGPVPVKIPRVKIDPQLHYDAHRNCFGVAEGTRIVEVGSKIRCKCFEVSATADVEMRVLATLPASLICFIE